MRRTEDVKIEAEGRDKGKVFHLVEMPALKGEKWAIRVLLALAKSGVDVPDDLPSMGLAGLAAVGITALRGLRYEEAETLLNEMMECISFVPNPQNPSVTRPLITEDIEEVQTLFTLRKKLFELHTGFSIPGAQSSLVSGKQGASA